MSYSVAYLHRRISIKASLFVLICIFSLIVYGPNLYNVHSTNPPYRLIDKVNFIPIHTEIVEDFYRHRAKWPTSKLGGILFKRDAIPNPNPNENRTFVILVWKHWNWLKNRHVYNFGSRNDENNALVGCSVKNCIFSGNESLIDTADAVLVHLQKGVIPEVENRNPKQRWIFLNDESPKNAFSLSHKLLIITHLNNLFNWSMTYRSDADVPVPYGRTIGLDKPLMDETNLINVTKIIPNWEKKRRDVLATVVMSNCAVKERNDFLSNLRKLISVDVYGGCSDKEELKDSCPGHFRADCEPVSRYLFYLVLENSNCLQYLTEKIFHHAYAKGAIPIIWGPSKIDVSSLLPPNSYIYADKNVNITKIASIIEDTADTEVNLISMHTWRTHFNVVNEHGYFRTKSYHLCRLCEALNYNDDKQKIYTENDLRKFLDPELICHK